jgi:tetratricopeptide (TPR) repeat protein
MGLCLILAMSLFFVGPSGRKQVDIRLEETVIQDTGLWGRSAIWKDTLRMVRDFPIFGVGLGSWPELFPRYKSPPWSSDFYREAHNDYLELLAEAGIVGFGLLAWFFYQAGSGIVRGLRLLPARASPVFAAFISALGMMAFHEFFDFNLQIPANAFLFTLFFALALRMTWFPVASRLPKFAVFQHSRLPAFQRFSVLVFLPISVGVIAFILLTLALIQEMIPYPYNLKEPTSLAEAREAILSHPARSSTHLSLFRLLENKVPLPWLVNELAISLWLNPGNYHARDLYAVALFKQGRKEEGLKEISRSVFDYPSLSGHLYLSGRLLPWLSAEEQRAVEGGFKEAMDHKYPGAIDGLGDFYGRLGRFSDQGKLYEKAALKEQDPREKADYLLKAGLAHTSAGMEKEATALFRQAVWATPKDPRPYQYLASAREYSMAKKVISEGIMNGADPFSLYLSLAEAAAKSGKPHEKEEALSSAKAVIPEMVKKRVDRFSLFLSLASMAQRVADREEEKSALLGALEMRPSSFEVTFRLGVLYLQENSFDRAALYFSKVIAFSPRSADAFYHLAVAEEGRYRFFAAGKAYARAVELAPHNTGFQQRYEAFKRKIAENQKADSVSPTGTTQQTR